MSGDRVREIRLSVPEMDCASCAATVERSVSAVEGVTDSDQLPASGTLVVRFDPSATSEDAIAGAVEGAGYPVDDGGDGAEGSDSVWRTPRAVATWIGAALLLAGVFLQFGLPGANPTLAAYLDEPVTVAWLAYLAAAAVAGVGVLRGGYASLRVRSLDVDLLMSGGFLAAVVIGLPFEAATLAVLYSLAELLERYSMDRARTSLRELVDLAPETATLVEGDDEEGERTVPVEAVDVGDVVAVRPGERVPVDGVVVDGESAVDESPVTGESVPAGKAPGDEVYAGSINEEGYLEVEATAQAGESTLARVIELVEDAERGKTDHEQFVDRFARYYTPIIVAGAILTVPATMVAFGLSFQAAFVRGLTLLVIACPCAFVISTPVSVVSGVTAAARNGVLVKGGDKLEAAGEVDVVALDKTGTLTKGELGLTDVVPVEAADESALFATASAIERRSEHPIARAIVEAADERGIDGPDVDGFETLPGRGVRADLDGTTHYAGKPGLFESFGIDLDSGPEATDGGVADGGVAVHDREPVGDTLARLEAEGKTVVVVGTEETVLGVLAVADTVRPEAERAVARLHDLGVETAMLTGDNERTARAIADRVGIDEVRADLLPEEKVEAVRRLGERGDGVAMVGDGINDAPALAAADVGIAMGAAGTDAAIETADVALLGDDLMRLPYLHRLARKANGVIRQNIWSSLGVKALLALGAPIGVVSVIAAIVVGDMGMSLAVTGNALRLAGVEPEE